MDINATLLVQMITFALFVWFTMKFVWPPISSALDERAQTINDGLASAEKGKRELELANKRVSESLHDAKVQANDILEKANKRGSQIIDEAKQQAMVEADKIHRQGQERLAQEIAQAKEALRKQVASLAVVGAEKILQKSVDESANKDILDSLIKEI